MSTVEINPNSTTLTLPKTDPVTALRRRPIILSVLVALATVVLFYPVHQHPFINYDDRDYVYQNPQVKSGISWHTVKWAFTTSATGNWHPLTWLSHEFDWQIFGGNPAGHHDVNLLFHTVDVILLFWVLLWATGFAGRSFMVAALFALHPINVESVAWIAERKNVLSLMFFLLALGVYRWYAVRPRVDRYIAVALLFALGLMAKPQIITLPCVLLLWDYWPLQRMFPPKCDSHDNAGKLSAPSRGFLWLVLEKVPLLAISAASAVITLRVQQASRMWFPRHVRVGNGILSYGLYLKKAIWPTGLALLYPHPGIALNWWKVAVSTVILLLITVLVVVGRSHRYLPVGWFWFLGVLVPTLGIVQVGFQALADRYAYVSFIGLFIMICWGTADLAQRLRLSLIVLQTASVAGLIILAVIARRQIDYWQTDEALWTHDLQVTTRNWIAESQLGTALAIDGRIEEAVPHFYKAMSINPDDVDSNGELAIYQLRRKNFSEAAIYYNRVVRQTSARPEILVNAWIGLAKIYLAIGDNAKAQECFQAAKRVNSPPGF